MVGVVTVVILALVVALVAVPRVGRSHRAGPAAVSGIAGDGPPASTVADRSVPPAIAGQPIQDLDPNRSPPIPAQWAEGDGPIPSNTWWSSAVVGPGAVSLWPQPLALSISAAGVVAIADPVARTRPDGSNEATVAPAVSLDLGASAATTVVAHGPLHATIRLTRTGDRSAAAASHADLTMVQGSPLVEITSRAEIDLLVPGLAVRPPGGSSRAVRLETAQGPWLLASDEPVSITVKGDRLAVTPGPAGRWVLGPLPAGSDHRYVEASQQIAAHPLVSTDEQLTVASDGTTDQVLSQARVGGTVASLWSLLPAHQRFAVHPGPSLGTVASAKGRLPVIAAEALRLVFPAVPVLWSAVPVPGSPAPEGADDPIPVEGSGSYYGGKLAYTNAAVGDALRLAGAKGGGARATTAAAALVSQLTASTGTPRLRWDPTWGSVVIDPAEFGADDQLNDHQLQYGYWVAAASLVADNDPATAARLRDVIDLLIADYAGAATVPRASSSLPAQRTWSPYEGHSWSSGTAPFGAGNDLESVSESSFAWWAAARWFLSTGRPEVAATFVARFTIESAMTGFEWLPQGRSLPSDPSHRPWSGVVWSGKSDPTTWFDPSPESALGIRLLPLGPASLGRYGSAESLAAARARWAWCDRYGGGCTGRWANLLDSDAAVARHAPVHGPTPEPSTTAVVSSWWRALWAAGDPALGWTCSVGAVARRSSDGTVTVLASNPGPTPVAMSCRDEHGVVRWSGRVLGTATATVDPKR